MTKKQTPAGYDRRAIMKDAHRRYQSRQHPGEIALPWAECLRRAWQAARIRRSDDTAATMRRIAGMIEDHLSRRIVLPPAIGEGMNHDANSMGFRLPPVADDRASRDGRRTVCGYKGAR